MIRTSATCWHTPANRLAALAFILDLCSVENEQRTANEATVTLKLSDIDLTIQLSNKQ